MPTHRTGSRWRTAGGPARRPSGRGGGTPAARRSSLLRRLGSYDRAVYRSVARMSTPLLDEPLRRVSGFANLSKPWFLVAGLLALVGGPNGRARRAHRAGGRRGGVPGSEPAHEDGRRTPPPRPGRPRVCPKQRWVRMPSSTSFPSGHSASAAAFAVAVGGVLPALRLPLRRQRRSWLLPRLHGRALPE